jgi:hypothetical protein
MTGARGVAAALAVIATGLRVRSTEVSMVGGRPYLALAVMFTVAVLCPTSATCGGALRIESPQLDVGKVMAGSPAVATFVFHNDGDRDVHILQAKPS